MNLRELNLKMMKDEVLRRILPLEVRKSYPYFSTDGENISLSFVCFKTDNKDGKIFAHYPSYCLKIAYPSCKLLALDTIKKPETDENSHTMLPKERKKIERLNALCDKAFQNADNNDLNSDKVFSEYNELLFDILEDEQKEILSKFICR